LVQQLESNKVIYQNLVQSNAELSNKYSEQQKEY